MFERTHILVFCGFGGPLDLRGSAYCGEKSEYFSMQRVLTIAALLILNNAIIILHGKLKRIPEKKVRNTDVEKLVLALVCDYNSTVVAHDTHQTPPQSKLVFKLLSYRSSTSGTPA
jgi:hypothetical protein